MLCVTCDSDDSDARKWGIHPDSGVDESLRIEAALNQVINDPTIGFLKLAPGEYILHRGINVSLDSVITWPHGLIGNGAKLVPVYNDNTDDVIYITSTSVTRFMRLEGFFIKGQGKAANRERHGVFLEVPLTGDHIYNFDIDFVVEGVAGDGCRLEGNIFEGRISLIARGVKGNGLTLGHHASGGALSSIHVKSLIAAQLDGRGLDIINTANDVWVDYIHASECGSYGAAASNGLRRISGHFENNHILAASDVIGTGQGAISTTAGLVKACYALNAAGLGKQTHLLRTFPANKVVVEKCVVGGATNSGNCELIHVSSAMSAGTKLEIVNSDGVRGTTPRTNIGNGIVVDEGSTYPFISAPTEGATVTVPDNPDSRHVLLQPAAGRTAVTLALPATRMYHGQRIGVSSTQAITTLTVSHANGVTPGTVGLAANGFAEYMYDANVPEWYRVG